MELVTMVGLSRRLNPERDVSHLQDAYVRWQFAKGWRWVAGQFKIPFSEEALRSSSTLDTRHLRDTRQGVQVAWDRTPWLVEFEWAQGLLETLSVVRGVPTPSTPPPWRRGFARETLSVVRGVPTVLAQNRCGWYGKVRYDVNRRLQFVVRVDDFYPNTGRAGGNGQRDVTVGFNYWLRRGRPDVKLQLNCVNRRAFSRVHVPVPIAKGGGAMATRSGSSGEPARHACRRRVDRANREGYNRAVRRHTFLNDIVFKAVFGTEDSSALLRSLTNALLELSGPDRIAEIQILNPVLDKRYHDDKGGVLDIRARDSAGRLFNIELQVCNQLAYVPRAVYYLSRMFGSQAAPGEGYELLRRAVSISLLDFSLFPDLADLHSTYRLYDEVHGRRLTDLLEFHFIELVKFRDNKPRTLMTPFEKWLHVLRFGEIYERGDEPLPPALESEEGIAMAIDRLRRAWSDDDLREYIESREKARKDQVSRLSFARNEGMTKGLAKGLAEGLAEGRMEGAREAARKMLESGMDRETICRVLGLSPEALP